MLFCLNCSRLFVLLATEYSQVFVAKKPYPAILQSSVTVQDILVIGVCVTAYHLQHNRNMVLWGI